MQNEEKENTLFWRFQYLREVPGAGVRHPEDVRWTGILQKELGDEYQVIEEGYGGRTNCIR